MESIRPSMGGRWNRESSGWPIIAGDVFGAFADTAVLFPLLAALSLRSDFSGPALLASAGAAYLAAGLFFRIPMPVQPLKSVAIAAIAVGASSGEVRLAGAVLALVCLALPAIAGTRWVERVPKPLIHGIQASLGVLLIMQGLSFSGGHYFLPGMLCLGVVAFSVFDWPAMGILATYGVISAIAHRAPVSVHLPSAEVWPGQASNGLRFGLVASLALPQIVLTLSNSVVGTADAAKRYFGAAAARVTPANLLRSIGIGNVVSAAFGGLPFCHGAGGLTAHVRGGARTWAMNVMVGGFFSALAAWQYLRGGVSIPYPPVLLAALLTATGLFHLTLARPTWNISVLEKARLILMGACVLVTHNLLWALAVGITPELVRGSFSRLRERPCEKAVKPLAGSLAHMPRQGGGVGAMSTGKGRGRRNVDDVSLRNRDLLAEIR